MESEKTNSYHHENLRQELIEKGIEIVANEGIEACSLRRVAADCNVSHNAPYSHFKNKEALLDAMKEYVTAQFSNELLECIKKAGKNPLAELGKTYLHFFIEHRAYFIFLFGNSNLKVDLTPSADSKTNYQPYEIFKSITVQTLQVMKYPKQKIEDAVIAIWAFIHGITTLATMKNVKYDHNWEEKITDFLAVFKL